MNNIEICLDVEIEYGIFITRLIDQKTWIRGLMPKEMVNDLVEIESLINEAGVKTEELFEAGCFHGLLKIISCFKYHKMTFEASIFLLRSISYAFSENFEEDIKKALI